MQESAQEIAIRLSKQLGRRTITQLRETCPQEIEDLSEQAFKLAMDYLRKRGVTDIQLREDLAQDAVIIMLQQLHSFDEERGRFSTWMGMKTQGVLSKYNERCNALKRQGEKYTKHFTDMGRNEDGDAFDVVENIKSAPSTLEPFKKIVAKLFPEETPQHGVVRDFFIHGCNVTEAAVNNHVKPNTARAYVSKAKRIIGMNEEARNIWYDLAQDSTHAR